MSVITTTHFAFLDQQNRDVNVSSGDTVNCKHMDILCLQFGEAQQSDLFKSLPSTITIHIPFDGAYLIDSFHFAVSSILEPWDYSVATYNNKPVTAEYDLTVTGSSHDESALIITISGNPSSIKNVILNGIAITFNIYPGTVVVYTPSSSRKPYVELVFGGGAEYYIDSVVPNNGIVLSSGEDNEFRWTFRSDDYTLGDIEVISSILIWKNVTSGGTEHIIDADSGLKVVFPANTIVPSSVTDLIQWYVEIELSNESTIRSSWTDVKFQEGKIKPALIYPVEVKVRTDEAITFSWNKTGSGTQTGILLVIEQNGEEVFSTDEISYTQNHYELPAGTIQKGVFIWKLKLQNSISVWGDFVSAQATGFASPSVPTSVTVSKPYPRFELAWTNSEDVNQIGFEIMAVPFTIHDWLNEGAFYPDKTDKEYSYIWYETGREEEAYRVLEPCVRYKMYGSETKFVAPRIIIVGFVTFYIRILDANGEWSKWLAFESEIIHMYSEVSNRDVTVSTEKVIDDYYYTNSYFKDARFDIKFEWLDPVITMPNQYSHLYFIDNGIIITRHFSEASTILPFDDITAEIVLDTSKYVFPNRDRRLIYSGSSRRFKDFVSNRRDCFYIIYQLISIEADPTSLEDAYTGKLPGDYIEFYPIGNEVDRSGSIDARTNFNFLVTIDDPNNIIAVPIYIYNEQPNTYDITEDADIDFTVFGNSLKPSAGPLKSKSKIYSFSCLTDEWNSQDSPYRTKLDVLHYSGGNIKVTHASALASMIGRKVLYRDIEGHVILGILNSTSRTVSSDGYTIWQCTITECNISLNDANRIFNNYNSVVNYYMNPNIAFD